MLRHAAVLSLLLACSASPSVQAPSAPSAPSERSATAVPEPPAASTPAGKPRTDLIPRAVMFGNPERVNVQISPDGKQLAWLAPVDGVLNVWVAPIGKLEQAVAVTRDTARPIRTYSWAYTSKHLLYSQDRGGDENFHVFRVDLADHKTTDLTPYTGARAWIARQTPRQPNTIVIAINDRDPKLYDLYKVDLLTGARTLMVRNTDNLSSFDLDDENRLRIASKRLPDGSIQLMTPAGGKPEAMTWKLFDTIPFDDSETTRITGFGPGGKTVYLLDSRGRDTAALVSIDLATRRHTVIAEDASSDAEDVLLHPTRQTVQAVRFNYFKRTWKPIDRAVAGDLAAIAKLEPSGTAAVVVGTIDDRKWIIETNSERKGVQYHLWNRTAKQAAFLFAARPELANHPLVAMHPVEIKSRDGLTLVSYLTLPAAADPDGDGVPNLPTPMLLLVHGGPWSRDHWGYNSLHQLLANRGYAVLAVNFRGSTGFGKKFLSAGNLQWGKAMHDDLIDAVGWAVQQGVTAKDTVCIMGGSYGGYATLAGLTITPEVFRCGVDIVGPSNLLTLLGSLPPYWGPTISRFHQRMGNPETAEGKALLVAASPLTHVARINKPLLIAQGANDPRVKQAESEQIVDAMKQRKLPVTYIVFPDEGHGFARPVNTIAFYGVAEAFLSAHLGGHYLPLTKAELEASSMQVKDGKAGVPGLP